MKFDSKENPTHILTNPEMTHPDSDRPIQSWTRLELYLHKLNVNLALMNLNQILPDLKISRTELNSKLVMHVTRYTPI